MTMMKKCSYCHKWYDEDEEHECNEKIDSRKQYNRKRQYKFAEEHKDTQGYKLIHSSKWKKFRRRIIASDGGYCQRCKIKYGTYTFDNLEVHHIKPRNTHPELMFEEDNVITVCKTCNAELGLEGIDFEWNPKDRGEIGVYKFI